MRYYTGTTGIIWRLNEEEYILEAYNKFKDWYGNPYTWRMIDRPGDWTHEKMMLNYGIREITESDVVLELI